MQLEATEFSIKQLKNEISKNVVRMKNGDMALETDTPCVTRKIFPCVLQINRRGSTTCPTRTLFTSDDILS